MSKSKKKKEELSKVQIPSFLRDAAMARLDDVRSKELFPKLSECLMPIYEGSTLVRQPGRLTIAVEGAHWKVGLDCPTERVACVFASGSLVTVLSDLEEWLASGRVVWRPGYQKNKKPLPTIDELIQ